MSHGNSSFNEGIKLNMCFTAQYRTGGLFITNVKLESAVVRLNALSIDLTAIVLTNASVMPSSSSIRAVSWLRNGKSVGIGIFKTIVMLFIMVQVSIPHIN